VNPDVFVHTKAVLSGSLARYASQSSRSVFPDARLVNEHVHGRERGARTGTWIARQERLAACSDMKHDGTRFEEYDTFFLKDRYLPDGL
jgi:hypothetical protein